MSFDLTKFKQGGLPANPKEMQSALRAAQQQVPKSTGSLFLKMNQFGSPQEGQLTYGAEATEVQEGSEWVVNWQALEHGYILRDGGSVNGEIYGSVFQPMPQDLRPTKGNEQWRQSYRGSLVCISGEDVGVEVEYGGDAGGMVKFFGMIMSAINSQLEVDPDSLYPVVTWTVTTYYSKKQKKDIYEAAGKIVAWMSQDELEEMAGGDVEDEVEQSEVLPPEGDAENTAEQPPEVEPEVEDVEPEPEPTPAKASRSRRPAAGAAAEPAAAKETPAARPAARRRKRSAAT